MKLTIDFETRSCADLKKFGAARYAQDPSTEVICLALKWQGQEPVLWYSPNFRSGVQSVSDETVKRMVDEAEVLEAHNAQFEFFVWKYVMPRYGFSMFDAGKLRCSLAKAAMYGLPRSLEQACEALAADAAAVQAAQGAESRYDERPRLGDSHILVRKPWGFCKAWGLLYAGCSGGGGPFLLSSGPSRNGTASLAA